MTDARLTATGCGGFVSVTCAAVLTGNDSLAPALPGFGASTGASGLDRGPSVPVALAAATTEQEQVGIAMTAAANAGEWFTILLTIGTQVDTS